VFPSGGSSNPTFTMMALACRLADLLNRKRKG
jgi:choline dehydrogenase-like flavoprotein